MSEIKVNTDKVVAAAESIRALNNQIRDGFGSVEKAIQRLDAAWDGSAASNAIAKFNSVKSNFMTPRYNAVNNYVNFLLQQVGQGYTEAEQANTSLADSFK